MENPTPIDINSVGMGVSGNGRRTKTTSKSTGKAQRQHKKPQNLTETDGVRLNPIIRSLTSQRTRLAVGVILSVICVVMLIVTFNFLKTGPADQSVLAENTLREAIDSSAQVKNVGGPLGAFIAKALMVDGLGIGAFVACIYLGGLALSLFGIVKLKFWAFTFRCLFTAIAISIILGFFTYNTESSIHWGGNHGRYVNMWLMKAGGTLTAFAVTIMLIGLLAVMYLNQLRYFYLKVSGRVTKARQAMTDAAAIARRPSTKLTEPVEEPVAASAEPTPKPVDKNVVAMTDAKTKQTAESQHDSIGFTIDDENPIQVSSNQAPEKSKAVNNQPEFTINIPVESGEKSAANKPVALTPPYSIRDELSHYSFPTPDLLIDRPVKNAYSEEEQESNKNLIIKTLKEFNIPIDRIEATIGPTVTLYEIVPAEGVRIASIRRLEEDIARQLEALGIRIIAPIPGKSTVGIEVPNRSPRIVSMRSVIDSAEFRDTKMELPMALGSTINNKIFIADLTKMPHLLVAGATGQGKSVGLNCIIASLLYKKHPGELKFVLIDPKMVEFSLYSRIERHYLAKLPGEEDAVITEPSKALSTLAALCQEMDDRYALLRKASVRNVAEYNAKFSRRVLNPENGHRFMPYLVIIVDEFADLIMVAGKDISQHICRIAQKARAVGMHMIIATQRPSTDVITGVIKANFPARMAFKVSSGIDSKTILDCTGAHRLIGRGDMLFSHNSSLERVQCAFIDTPEVEELVEFIARQTAYPTAYELPEPETEKTSLPGEVDLSHRDELFDTCARFVSMNDTTSVSLLQRRFGIGYNKAGKIMDQLEAAGIVGAANGQKARPVLVDAAGVEALLASL